MATKEEVLEPGFLAGLPVAKVKERSKYLNILIYGDSGVGKTTLAGSADAVPSMRPVLDIDIEGGSESLRRTYPNVEQVRVTNWNEMQDLYDELRKGDHGYQTVILDSLTEIQKFSMYNIMDRVTALDPGRDPDIPGMREWGKNIEQLRKFVRAFRDLPVHTIFTALVRDDKDQRSGLTKYKPSMSGKVANEVAGMLDIVSYYYVRQEKDGDEVINNRYLLTGATEQYTAKDRSGKLPTVVENPTMKELYDYMNTEEKK